MAKMQQILLAFIDSLPSINEPNLIAAYRGENNVLDSIGTAHGTAGSQTTYTPGQVGNSFVFNGNTNSKVSIPLLNLGSAWTIEFWVYRTSGFGDVIANTSTSVSNFGAILFDSVNFGLYYYSNNIIRAVLDVTKIPVATWKKVALTYDGSRHRFYINELLQFKNSVNVIEEFNTSLALGGSPSGGTFNGRLDEVKFFNIAKQYQKLIGYYAGESNANDSSGNSLNATAGSSPAYGLGYDGVNNAFLFNNTSAARVLIPIFTMEDKWSVEFYAYPTNTNPDYQIMIGHAWNGGATFGSFYFRTNKVEYWSGSASRVASTSGSVPLATWTKIKLTYDGSKCRIYINDILNATESGTHSESWTQNSTVGLGGDAGVETTYFIGRIDEVKIYNYIV